MRMNESPRAALLFYFISIFFSSSFHSVIIASFSLCSCIRWSTIIGLFVWARSRFDEPNELFTFVMLTDSKIVLIYLIMVIIIITASLGCAWYTCKTWDTSQSTIQDAFNIVFNQKVECIRENHNSPESAQASATLWHIMRIHGYSFLGF